MDFKHSDAMGAGRVLVVDDNEAVANILERCLGQHGYEVEVAHDGLAALHSIDARVPDLVVLDVVMPGMNGRELGRQVTLRWPGKPVLYMSGFPSEVFQGGLLEPGAPFLPKPFTQEDLALKVRSLLGNQTRP
jgi:two-component system response regulator MprA